MRSFSVSLRPGLLVLATVVPFASAPGCGPRSTPPSPSAIASSGPGLSFSLHRWKEGLNLLLVDDLPGGHGSHGSGSTNNPVWSESGSGGTADGTGYKWQLETTDGMTARFRLDGKEYDLANGTLFVITRQDKQLTVHQLKRDLSAVPHDADKCREYLTRDEEVQKLLHGDAPR
jgi:hypothetical protein